MARGEGGGRPKIPIDGTLVEKLASIHCTMEEIASVCSCSVDTLERRFAETIKQAKAKGRSSLRRYQWEAAQKGNTGMLIWLGKQLLDQTEKVEQRVDLDLTRRAREVSVMPRTEQIKLLREELKRLEGESDVV